MFFFVVLFFFFFQFSVLCFERKHLQVGFSVSPTSAAPAASGAFAKLCQNDFSTPKRRALSI